MSEVAVVSDVARATAELFVEATAGAVAARGRAAVALTGGSSAPALYQELSKARNIPWAQTHLFFGDERAVAASDPLSNVGLAQRGLHTEAKLHVLHGDAADLAGEARSAAADLRGTLGSPPRFDLVLLGLGPDGHILSLFAGVPGSAERGDEELFRAVAAPTQVEPHVARLTLTPFLLITARLVVLQVAGARKADVLARVLKAPEDLVACPAQWLRRASGRVVVVADSEAAKGL